VVAWFMDRPTIPILRVGYRRVLQNPMQSAEALKDFLRIDLNVEAMAREVDPSLYRNRSAWLTS
jgi:hypothetical protein